MKKLIAIKNLLWNNKWLIFFLLGAISFLWVKKQGALAWGVDSAFPLDIKYYVSQYFYFWTDKVAFSTPDASKFPMISPFVMLLLIIKSLGIHYSPVVFQKVIFYLLFSFSGFSAYQLFKATFPERGETGRLAFGRFYMFNFYSLISWHAQSWIIFFYVFFPLVLSLITGAVVLKKPVTYYLITAILWSLLVTPSYVTPPFMIISWVLIGLLFLYQLICNRENARYLVLSFMALFLSWLVLNYYWLAPQFLFFQSEFARRGVPGDQFALLGYNSSTLIDVLRFLGPKFFKETYLGSAVYPWFSSYQTAFFVLVGFVPVAFIFYSIKMRALKNKMYTFWMLVFLMAIVLLMGTNFPLELQFYKAFSFLKLAQIFRSIWQRFMPLMVISGGLLFAYGLDVLAHNIAKQKIFLRNIVVIGTLFLVCVVYGFPFWTGRVYMGKRAGQPSEQIVIPEYYYQASEWINKQNDTGNFVPLPFLKMGLIPLNWNNGEDGFYGAYPLILTTDKSYMITDVDLGFDQKLFTALKNNDQKFFDDYDIEYLIYHSDMNWDFIKSSNWYSDLDQATVQNLVSSSVVFKKEVEFGQLTIYKNQNTHLSKVNLPGANVRYHKISPVQYSFEINNLKDKQTLKLSELQNAGWNIYLLKSNEPAEKNVFDQLRDFSGPGPLKPNQLSDTSADGIVHNSWTLDPEAIKSSVDKSLYSSNADGSINLRGVLYFQPQTRLIQAFAVSLTALVLILLLCLIWSVKRNVKKNK